MMKSMYDIQVRMAKSFKMSALMDDPSVRPCLVGLAGPEFSAVLVSNFEVDDIENLSL